MAGVKSDIDSPLDEGGFQHTPGLQERKGTGLLCKHHRSFPVLRTVPLFWTAPLSTNPCGAYIRLQLTLQVSAALAGALRQTAMYFTGRSTMGRYFILMDNFFYSAKGDLLT